MARNDKTTEFYTKDGGKIEIERFITFIGLDVTSETDTPPYTPATVAVNLPLDQAEAFANKVLEYVAEARR